METDSYSYKTLRNSVYLFAGFLFPMAFTIFVTRALAYKLGPGEYGIFLLLNAISTFINYVDLGLGTAVTKYTSEYQASGNRKGMENLLSSARLLFMFTGFIGFLIFFILGRWFLPIFHVSPQSMPHIFIVFLLAGGVFFFNSLIAIYAAVLTSLQRFDLLTKLNLSGLAATSIGTVVLLDMHFRLKAIMGLNLVMDLIYLAVYHFLVRRLLPELKLKFIFDKLEIKKAYGFGLLAFVSNLASSCLVYLDRLIIPIFLGPSQLAFYSVPGNVGLKVTSVTNSLSGMFFPMASGLVGAGEIYKLKNIYIRAFRNLSVAAAATSVAIIMFANKILLFWVGPEFAANGTKILIISAFAYYIISLYQPLQSILLGLGRVKFLVWQSLLMAGINLILLLIVVPRYGIIGAAWAYLISVLPMIFAFYWIERNVFNISGQLGYYAKLYFRLFTVSMIDAAAIYFLLLPLATSVWKLVFIGPLAVILYVLIYYLFGFTEKEDEVLVKSFLQKFLRLKTIS